MRPLLPLLAALLATACAVPVDSESGSPESEAPESIAETTQDLTNGSVSSEATVVQIVHRASGRKCVGTVIGKDVVISSSMCLFGVLRLADIPADRYGAGWIYTGPFDVRFGANAASPTRTILGSWVNVLSRSSDLALLGLEEPSPVTALPVHLTSSVSPGGATVVGYSATGVKSHGIAQVGHAITFYEPLQVFASFVHPSPVRYDLQDRGAPVIIGGRLYAVVSSLDDGGPSGSGDSTAGNIPITSSPLRQWLRRATELSACAERAGFEGFRRHALYHWKEGGNHFAQTGFEMAGCFAGDKRRITETRILEFQNIEGFIVPPTAARPPGGRELRLFRNSLTGDTATSTVENPPGVGGGWDAGTRLGWIFSSSASDRVELFRFRHLLTGEFRTQLGSRAPDGYGAGVSLGFVYRDPFAPLDWTPTFPPSGGLLPFPG